MYLLGFYTTGELNFSLLLMALASWCSTIAFDLVMVRHIHSFKLTDKWKNSLILVRETVPLCVYSFLSAAISVIPKYILEKMTDSTTLGAYSSIFAPAVIMQAAAGYIYVPFVDRFAELYTNKKYKEFGILAVKLVLALLGFGAVVIIAALFLGDFALELVFGSSILEFSYMLIPALIATICTALAMFMCVLEVVVRDFKNLILGCVLGCAAAIAFTPLMINLMGANGTSHGMSISGLISVGYMTVALVIKIKKKTQSDRRISNG